jgi:hypothetical protein
MPLRVDRSSIAALVLAVVAILGIGWIATAGEVGAQRPQGAGLAAFGSERALRAYLHRFRNERRARAVMYDMAPPAMTVAEPAPVMANQPRQPGITNNQEAGVDEGDIVKAHGDLLVILRRGRLFTVSLAGGGMRTVAAIDAYPPGVDPSADWYDEMLIAGGRVVVIGYSYGRGGMVLNRFRLDPRGGLRFEDAYDLRANDYYSSRNYASRLIGSRLVFYTPLYLGWDKDPDEALPAMRQWVAGTPRRFRPIAGASRIFVPPALRNAPREAAATLHTVTSCDLAAPRLDCEATGVVGPESRSFYVADDAVYLWLADSWSPHARSRRNALVYRLPFGDGRPAAVAARGAPVDQFSFREDRAAGTLDVLLRADGGGDAMWRPEVTDGAVALLRLPLADFGDGSREVPLSRYRPLPAPGGESWNFHNRFVGGYVLYGGGAFDGRASAGAIFAAPVAGGAVARLALSHPLDRIEALGADALAVGSAGKALGFTAVELGTAARLGDRYTLAGAAEGEERSHAFFFRPDGESADGASGLLGLPITAAEAPGYERFLGSAASILFLHRRDRRFLEGGRLEARSGGRDDDGCKASCVDWYGNARPIFLGGRVFALMGYELVEGRVGREGPIREVARISFAPAPRRG